MKRGIMENPNIAASSQEDLVNLKLQVCIVACHEISKRLLSLSGQLFNMPEQYVMS